MHWRRPAPVTPAHKFAVWMMTACRDSAFATRVMSWRWMRSHATVMHVYIRIHKQVHVEECTLCRSEILSTSDCGRARNDGCLFQTSMSAQLAPTPVAPTVNVTTLRAAMTAAVTLATCFRATRGRVFVSNGHMHFVRYHVNFVSGFVSTSRFFRDSCKYSVFVYINRAMRMYM